MGFEKNIDIDKFPKQGKHLNKQVRVCFHYNFKKALCGLVVRDDAEVPFYTIISLEDGRVILATECQYQLIE